MAEPHAIRRMSEELAAHSVQPRSQGYALPGLTTRASELVTLIEAKIEDEGLQPGAHLGTKEDLRKLSGMARATVNEAVRLLCDRGRVEMRPGPGGGIFVAAPTPMVQLGRLFLSVGDQATHTSQVAAVRDHLESMIVEEAVRHRSAEDLRDLDSCLERIKAQREAKEFLSAVWTLHERIAVITPNAVLRTTYLGLMQGIRTGVTAVERTTDSDREYFDKRIAAHEALVEAIRSGDPEAVPEAIRIHHATEKG
ncbi:FadR/GntR family transcriptional regulator [Sediminivirga luteola]|uniref:GntR family transcriptional regulator n=1 Tax=Sediminivirga luteola TaxID=1774748 RepID=A0A8J2TWT1_9MICO|nr:FCD domain-containing protein [Sediminivirga luteola]MCI2267040.1 FCD domain-containing protein [Sediminivirga luteola]GGA09460.1 GntR family transcriptional regulator [Sediminivirga luteola]